MDTWLLMRNIENNGEKTRTFYIYKSVRGMAHSNQVREFVMTKKGLGLGWTLLRWPRKGKLTGTGARGAGSELNAPKPLSRQRVNALKLRQLERKRKAITAQVVALEAELRAEEDELNTSAADERVMEAGKVADRRKMIQLRGGAANGKSLTTRNG